MPEEQLTLPFTPRLTTKDFTHSSEMSLWLGVDTEIEGRLHNTANGSVGHVRIDAPAKTSFNSLRTGSPAALRDLASACLLLAQQLDEAWSAPPEEARA